MTKAFLGFTALITTFSMTMSAQARTPMLPASTNDVVLELLIKEAGNITLVDAEQKPFDAYYQLPALFARQLKAQYRQPKADETYISFGNTNVDCKAVPATGRAGSTDYNCTVVIATEDYHASQGVIGSKDTEGGIVLSFVVTREVRAGNFVKLASKTIDAMLAN